VVERVRQIIGDNRDVHNHHNYAWRETHDGKDLWVVRKGATPAFPGQKGFVGGSMGDDAVILEGVDSPQWATTKPEIQRWVCRAEWDKYGPSAGPRRNARMVEWKPDVVIAFPGNRGTADMVEKAESDGIPVRQVLSYQPRNGGITMP
jgi:RNA-splicing ligase RtcB